MEFGAQVLKHEWFTRLRMKKQNKETKEARARFEAVRELEQFESGTPSSTQSDCQYAPAARARDAEAAEVSSPIAESPQPLASLKSQERSRV